MKEGKLARVEKNVASRTVKFTALTVDVIFVYPLHKRMIAWRLRETKHENKKCSILPYKFYFIHSTFHHVEIVNIGLESVRGATSQPVTTLIGAPARDVHGCTLIVPFPTIYVCVGSVAVSKGNIYCALISDKFSLGNSALMEICTY
jgi:hypothetical protein